MPGQSVMHAPRVAGCKSASAPPTCRPSISTADQRLSKKHLVIGGPLHGCYVDGASGICTERTDEFTRASWRDRGLPDEEPYRYALAEHCGQLWFVPASAADLEDAIYAARSAGVRSHLGLLKVVLRRPAEVDVEPPVKPL